MAPSIAAETRYLPAFLEPHEGFSPCRMVRCEAGAGDRDQAPAVGKTRER
jgi:hypothetical protein